MAERSNPTSKEQWLHGRRRAERSYSTFNVRMGSHEEIPLVQGKEQRLRFAGAAVKTPKPLTLWGALPHYLSLKKELAYSSS